MQCLSDKSADIRNKTEQIIEFLCANYPGASSEIKEEVNRMPKAQQLSIAPIIDKYCKSSGDSAAPTPSNAAAPKIVFN